MPVCNAVAPQLAWPINDVRLSFGAAPQMAIPIGGVPTGVTNVTNFGATHSFGSSYVPVSPNGYVPNGAHAALQPASVQMRPPSSLVGGSPNPRPITRWRLFIFRAS